MQLELSLENLCQAHFRMRKELPKAAQIRIVPVLLIIIAHTVSWIECATNENHYHL